MFGDGSIIAISASSARSRSHSASPTSRSSSWTTSIPCSPSLIVVNIWKEFPFAMIMVLAGLQTVPEQFFAPRGWMARALARVLARDVPASAGCQHDHRAAAGRDQHQRLHNSLDHDGRWARGRIAYLDHRDLRDGIWTAPLRPCGGLFGDLVPYPDVSRLLLCPRADQYGRGGAGARNEHRQADRWLACRRLGIPDVAAAVRHPADGHGCC